MYYFIYSGYHPQFIILAGYDLTYPVMGSDNRLIKQVGYENDLFWMILNNIDANNEAKRINSAIEYS